VGAKVIEADEEPEEVLGLLGTLVEHSLVEVQQPEEDGEVRYGMLEPVRQYASEKLEQSAEVEEVRRSLAQFFLELAEEVQPRLRGPVQSQWAERLERESDNLRAVFSWALGDAADAQTSARLGWALQGFLWTRGYHREGRRWAEATLEHELPDGLRAKTLHLAAMTAYVQGDYIAAGERWGESLHLSQRARDVLVEAYSRAGAGVVEMARSEHEAAIPHLEGAIALFERCGDDYMAAASRGWLGLALLASGEGERARGAFEEVLELARPTKNPALVQTALYNLAQSALARGDYAEAGLMLEEAIGLSRQVGDRISLAQYLGALAVAASSRGDAKRSAILLGAAEGLLREVGAPGYDFYDPDHSIRERPAVEARASLGEAAFEEAQEQGRSMTFEQAVEYALQGNRAPSA
jgi:non-specific serine/threonine protein kinase